MNYFSLDKENPSAWAVLLASDIRQIYKTLAGIDRPEGRTAADNAASAYVMQLLEAARKIEDQLSQL